MARCQYQKDRDLTEEWGLEMKILRTLTAMASAAAALTIAAQARADVIDFYLNQPECTGSCTTVPASSSRIRFRGRGNRHGDGLAGRLHRCNGRIQSARQQHYRHPRLHQR